MAYPLHMFFSFHFTPQIFCWHNQLKRCDIFSETFALLGQWQRQLNNHWKIWCENRIANMSMQKVKRETANLYTYKVCNVHNYFDCIWLMWPILCLFRSFYGLYSVQIVDKWQKNDRQSRRELRHQTRARDIFREFIVVCLFARGYSRFYDK